MLTGQWIDWHTWPRVFRTYAFAIVVIFYLSKIIFSLFLATDDILRVFRWENIQALQLRGCYRRGQDQPLSVSGTPGLCRREYSVAVDAVRHDRRSPIVIR